MLLFWISICQRILKKNYFMVSTKNIKQISVLVIIIITINVS